MEIKELIKKGLVLVLIMGLTGCSLFTDRGQKIKLANPAKPMPDPKDIPEEKKKVKDKGTMVRIAKKQCNCVGFSLGRGDWEIDTAEIPLILKDNYTIVPKGRGKVQVCDIIVYGSKENGFDHVGLVIEVKNDKPTLVRSKTATSIYVYDHPPNHQAYGSDNNIYRRTSTDKLPAEQKKKIKKLQDAYNKIENKSSTEARNAAAKLCQEKNAMLETKP